MIYKEKVKIGLKDIWEKNEISNTAILEYLENAAGYHSDSLGYGINGTKSPELSWILLEWKVKVLKRPLYGQILDIHTWSREIYKFYAYRDFEIYDENNNLCVIASSKWILINNKTGKICKVDEKMQKDYDSETEKIVFRGNNNEEEKEKKKTIDVIEKLKEPKEYKNSIIYKAMRKDIDIIGHMHNLYYLDLAYEALPDEVYNKRPFDEFEIMYKKEIKLGEEVIIKYGYDEGHIIVIKSKDEKTLHAIIKLL